MKKILLLYASMSGNTEEIANLVAEGLRESGIDPTIKDIMSAPSAHEMLEYDGVIIGSYTWGDGELPDDFLDFYEEMGGIDLSGKKAAVFGSGDHAYLEFCAAVEILEKKLVECNAQLVQEGLRIEMSPTNAEKPICKEFGARFAQHFVSVT